MGACLTRELDRLFFMIRFLLFEYKFTVMCENK